MMTSKLTIYKPSYAVAPEDRGADLCVKIMKDNTNDALRIGRALFALAREEGIEPSVDRTSFHANFMYTIPGELSFRLLDDGTGNGGEVLEFVALNDQEPALSQALARIPNLLARAGVEQSAMVELRNVVAVGHERKP